MQLPRWWWVVLTSLPSALSCTPGPAPQGPEPLPPDTAVSRVEPSGSGPWHFMHAPGVHRFELRSTAIIEAVDTGIVDTTALSAHLTYGAAHHDRSVLLTGTIDSVSVDVIADSTQRMPSASPAHVPPGILPIAFQMRIDSTGRVLDFTSPDTASCGSPAGTLLAIARDLMVGVPNSVSVGSRWADTTTSTSCRGDIPITLTSIRSHTVEGTAVKDGVLVLRVRRETSTEIVGTGTRRVQTTSVTGRGQGWSELLLDPESGHYLGGHGESTLELTFDAASRRMTFRQRTQQVVVRTL
jgi:hypothetical protein